MNKPVLALALAATIAAAIFAPKEEADDVVAPVKPGNSASSAAGSPSNASASAVASATLTATANSRASASAVLGANSLQIIPRHFDDANGDKGIQDESKLAQAKGKKNQPEQNSTATSAPTVLSASWGGNLFANTNWQPPPPPPPPKATKPPPPPPPSAPPLPFQYLGRWIEDGKVHYFLQYRERSLNVEVGAQIDQYKFDSAQHGQLRFIYLPLKEVQTIAVGEIN
ncbi:MAG: hypothetical protein HYZ45_10020 [Burkholderiales bacterium]|nr:hypothetical protein [Burkholderiales bacterium]